MSSREWIFRVRDILAAIDKIERYVKDMTLAEFKQDELVIDAVIRNFEIIGEASKSLPPSVRHAHPEIPWNEMSAMRNVLIHEYFGVDVKILWYTSKQHFPPLQKQLKALLEEASSLK